MRSSDVVALLVLSYCGVCRKGRSQEEAMMTCSDCVHHLVSQSLTSLLLTDQVSAAEFVLRASITVISPLTRACIHSLVR